MSNCPIGIVLKAILFMRAITRSFAIVIKRFIISLRFCFYIMRGRPINVTEACVVVLYLYLLNRIIFLIVHFFCLEAPNLVVGYFANNTDHKYTRIQFIHDIIIIIIIIVGHCESLVKSVFTHSCV